PSPATPTPFPYTTLFRSHGRLPRGREAGLRAAGPRAVARRPPHPRVARQLLGHAVSRELLRRARGDGPHRLRSGARDRPAGAAADRKSTRLNSSHEWISY